MTCEPKAIETCEDQSGCTFRRCSCEPVIIEITGGVECGGEAIISDNIILGGIELGGEAVVDVPCDPWDGLVLVLPLNETGNGTPDEYKDRSAFGHHGTGGGGMLEHAPAQDEGVFCQPSARFTGLDGGREFIVLPPDPIKPWQPFTVSLWVRPGDELFTQRWWFSRGYGTDHWAFAIGHSVLKHVWARVQTPEDVYEVMSDKILNENAWHHVAAVFVPSDSLKVYINGRLAGTVEVPDAETVAPANGSFVGMFDGGGYSDANIQDLRLAPVARSADWLKAEHDNYCDLSFFTVGEWSSPAFD